MNSEDASTAEMGRPSSEPALSLQVGDVVGARYEIVRTLGQGGMGIVFEAKNVHTGGRVALKLLRMNVVERGDLAVRFTREAKAAGGLRSPHVVRVLDVDHTDDGCPYLVMELLQGADLQSELKRRRLMPFQEAVEIVLEACAGLAEAHARGFIHRDLKPANLFLAQDGGRRVAKVLDFGMTKNLDADEEVTRSFSALGTPSYMSPEQVKDAKRVDQRTDVWSLAVILYRAITGELPFKGNATAVAVAIATETPSAPSLLVPGVPPRLDAVIMRALRKKQEERFPNIAVFARELAPFAEPSLAARVLAEIESVASLGGRVDFTPISPISTIPPDGGLKLSSSKLRVPPAPRIEYAAEAAPLVPQAPTPVVMDLAEAKAPSRARWIVGAVLVVSAIVGGVLVFWGKRADETAERATSPTSLSASSPPTASSPVAPSTATVSATPSVVGTASSPPPPVAPKPTTKVSPSSSKPVVTTTPTTKPVLPDRLD